MVAIAKIPIASQAQMESASSTTTAASPGRTQNHPGTAKAWVYFDGTDVTISPSASHNLDGVTPLVDRGTGQYTVNFDTDFSSANYMVQITHDFTSSFEQGTDVLTLAVGSTQFDTGAGGSFGDPTHVHFAAFGDQ